MPLSAIPELGRSHPLEVSFRLNLSFARAESLDDMISIRRRKP